MLCYQNLKRTAWKVSKYRVFSGPYFPAFGLNMEIYLSRVVVVCIEGMAFIFMTYSFYLFLFYSITPKNSSLVCRIYPPQPSRLCRACNINKMFLYRVMLMKLQPWT